MSAPRETAPTGWTALALIRRTQGRKGEVFADLLTDFPEKFASRRRLWLIPADRSTQGESAAAPGHSSLGTSEPAYSSGGAPGPSHLGTGGQNPIREAELTNHWLHKGGIVLHFAGIDSISAAEPLKGLTVAIPREQRSPLAEDEVYIGDLIGCTLVDLAGATPIEVGTIEDVDRTAGPAPLLVVRGAKGEVLAPFAKAWLRKLDLAAKRIEMSLPEGLVDLNAADKSSR